MLPIQQELKELFGQDHARATVPSAAQGGPVLEEEEEEEDDVLCRNCSPQE